MSDKDYEAEMEADRKGVSEPEGHHKMEKLMDKGKDYAPYPQFAKQNMGQYDNPENSRDETGDLETTQGPAHEERARLLNKSDKMPLNSDELKNLKELNKIEKDMVKQNEQE